MAAALIHLTPIQREPTDPLAVQAEEQLFWHAVSEAGWLGDGTLQEPGSQPHSAPAAVCETEGACPAEPAPPDKP